MLNNPKSISTDYARLYHEAQAMLHFKDEALRQSENRFQQLADTLTSAIFIVRDDKCLFANRAAELMSGYTIAELKEMVIWDVFPLSIREKVKKDFVPQFEAAKVTIVDEFPFVTKSGETRWAYSSNSLIDYEGSPAILTTTVDITERRLAQKALEQSEERFAKAFNYAPSAMTISDKNSRFVDANNIFLRAMGFQREEVLGHTGEELGIWVDFEDRAKFIQTLQVFGSTRDLEVSLRSKSGGILIGLMSAEILQLNGETYLLSTFVDISERKRAEAALRQSEERLRHSMRIEADGTYSGSTFFYKQL